MRCVREDCLLLDMSKVDGRVVGAEYAVFVLL